MNVQTKFTFSRVAPWLGRSLVPNFNEVFSVKGGRPFVKYLIQMLYIIRDGVVPGLVRVCSSYCWTIGSMYRKSGSKFTVKYLKACQLILMQVAGKQSPLVLPRTFGVAVSITASGIPRIIPKAHRAFIRNGSKFHVRLWITLFGLYRVLSFPSQPSINTIIEPGTPLSNSFFGELIVTIEGFFNLHPWKGMMNQYKPWYILTRGATSVSFDLYDRRVRSPSGTLHSVLSALTSHRDTNVQIGTREPWLKMVARICNYVGVPGGARLFVSLGPLTALLVNFPNQLLGRLAFKDEPAGKVRVFAMVDAFTQWMLQPIHLTIFALLKDIPQDATFDQRGAVKNFTTYLKVNNIKEVWSLDLTAATDRLPLTIQTLVLSTLLGPTLAQDWANFLVGRWYKLPSYPRDGRATRMAWLGVKPNPYLQTTYLKAISGRTYQHVSAVRYAVGQPMGALSSWAMLALTHHIIVHMAARRAGVGTLAYLILGDDIVIADGKIAEAYLGIMREIGCPINLSKSLASSNGSFEFAKRFICEYEDCTPISWRELFVAGLDIASLQNLVEQFHCRLSSVCAFMGHGYHAISRAGGRFSKMSRSMALLVAWLSRPGAPFAQTQSFSGWFSSISLGKITSDLIDFRAVKVMLQTLMMDRLRGLYPKDVILNEYSLGKEIKNLVPETEPDPFIQGLVKVLTSMLWTSVYSPMLESEVKTVFAARGSIMKLASLIPKARDIVSLYDAVDRTHELFENVDNEANVSVDHSWRAWAERDKFITINSCTTLRWFEKYRKPNKLLAIAPRTKSNQPSTRKVSSDKVNHKLKS